jgi:hypothetical protein
MNKPIAIDTRPTGRAPRRFTAVAVQIIASEISHCTPFDSPGTKNARYWLKSTG